MHPRSHILASGIALSLLVAADLRAIVDFDHDGVSDLWREQYSNAGAPDADPDGDGASNLAESFAGTDPFSASSRLVAYELENDASGNLVLRWAGLPGKRYRIDSTTNLVTWTLGTELLTAAQCPHIVRPFGAPPRPQQFWRVTAIDIDTDGDGVNDWEEACLGSDPLVPAIMLQSHFVPFGMCFSDITAAEQISRCQSRGFTGLGIQQFDLDSLKAFAANAEVTSGRFKIYSALWFVNTDAVFTTATITDLKPKLAELQKMKAYLWMVFDTNSGNAVALTNAVANARKVADACALYGVTLVIYPHGGCAFYKAEQAKGYLPQINRANVKLSIHLCHELMAGNGSRIAAVVDAVKNDIVLASVCGSDTAINPDDNWASQIQPLDRGDYDVAPFLQALAAAGYAGPMELHTYNLGDPGVTPTAADHLTRSMKKWRTLVAPTAHVP